MRQGKQIIDADGHVMEPPDLWDRYMDPEFYGVRPRGSQTDVSIELLGKRISRSSESKRFWEHNREDMGAGPFAAAAEQGYSAASHLAMMDEEGIDFMVLYPSRGLFAAAIGDLDGSIASAIGRAYDRWLADYCAENERLKGMALVPLHDPTRAAADAVWAVDELGLTGVMVRPNPAHGRNLHDAAYDDFYSTLEDLDVPLSVHEGCGVFMPQYGIDRFDEHIIWHAMCHPMEQMGAVVSFTLGGIWERHPQLDVAFLESGAGWLPYWLHRLDEHVEWLGEIETPELTATPTEYFRRRGYIGMEGDEPALRAVVDAVGPERLLWASDYPHPDAKYPGMVDAFLKVDDLTSAEQGLILGDNPRRFYRLSASDDAGDEGATASMVSS